MKKILFALLFFCASISQAATTYYGVNAGGSWETAGTWSTVSAKDVTRIGGATTITSADTVILDDYSGSVTVTGVAAVCGVLDCVSNGNHAGQLNIGSAKILTMSGAVTLSPAMTLPGTGTLTFSSATCSIKSNGVTLAGSFRGTGSTPNLTLVDDWHILGDLTNASGLQLIGNNFYVGGSIAASASMYGTATVIENGSGTISTASSAIFLSNNLTVNTAGTVTIGASLGYTAGTFTWTAGTIAGSGVLYPAACNLNLGSAKMPNVYTPSSSSVTLLSDLLVGNYSSFGLSPTFVGSYNITFDTFNFFSTASLRTFTAGAGTTLTVSTGVTIVGCGFPSASALLKSGTASSALCFKYLGTPGNCSVFGATFTDVDASGSVMGWLPNYNGGTLTRTEGIRNINLPDWHVVDDGWFE